MKDRSNYCIYHKPACNAGCTKVFCKAFFPDRQPLIMAKDLPMCESLNHRECQQFIAGNAYQEERRRSKKGCPFLADKVCIKPNTFWCHGRTPAFEVTKDNNLESCQGNDFKNCPYYSEGIAFQEEAKRKKERIVITAKE